MGDIFLKVLNMSIAASWLILAVALLRVVLKKAPKWTAVLLWGIVALRLAAPFSFESVLSLLPSEKAIDIKTYPSRLVVKMGFVPIDGMVNDHLGDTYFEGVTVPTGHTQRILALLSVVWLIGAAALLLYAIISYGRIYRSVAERVPYEGNIFLCDHVKSPFILGLFRPKIYLPSNMDKTAIEPVIAHERAHLARHDHWWKPIGFLILAVHWFNPLCWAAYVLLCRDIELACDEKVIQQMDLDGKKQYSVALLECSAQGRLVTVCPLAFGEVGVKERIKSVLNYKKPAFWGVAAAVIAGAAVTVCFATNPVSAENYIRLQSTHSTPPAAFFSLDLTEDTQGTVIAECWENGRCISTNPVFMNNLTQQIQLYLDPQENGVNVQLGVDNGDTILELFAYPKGEKPVGWSFVSLDERKKTAMQSGKNQIIAAISFDFGAGVEARSCDVLSADEKLVENAPYLIVIRAFLGNSGDSAAEPKPDGGGEPAPEEPDVFTFSAEKTAIQKAILGQNRSVDTPLDVISCCSFLTLGTESGGPADVGTIQCATHFGWALYKEYRATEGVGLEEFGGSYLPVAITFEYDKLGYSLLEYWQPRDGSYYTQDIREKFPSYIVEDGMDSQKFIFRQTQECYEQAIEYTNLSTDPVITALIGTICASPALSSIPKDYINAHSMEYQELIYYGQYTLKYCFTRFEKGNETGLDGQIMRQACEEIAAGWGEVLILEIPAETGQQWYNRFRNNALILPKQYSEMELAERYPASYLLLSMLGEV